MNDNSKLANPIRNFTGLVRPKYSPGLLLQDDDLTAAVSYTRNLSRLMFRTLFGCGVLCGLEVDTPQKDNCGKLVVDIDKGVALSCAGDPIEVPKSQIKIDTCENDLPCFLWFAVRHVESGCGPRVAQCSPDDDEQPPACTRERDGYELRVFPERPPCSCGCKKLGPAPPPPAPPAPTPTPPPPDPVLLSVTRGKESKSSKASERRQSRLEAEADDKTQSTASAITAADSNTECVDPETPETRTDDPCLCNQRTAEGACYEEHYQGKCPCDCCDCDWVILAVAARQDLEGMNWTVDHSVRRFVRPVLMRDPLVP
jgi:hypothetical protein